jgi:hypothetical protein
MIPSFKSTWRRRHKTIIEYKGCNDTIVQVYVEEAALSE